ncbi:hypothetical protein LOTGIDRAFT_141127 [Lottia gigantea]|uniref:G-protein coupled receptors family 3 profile domain-containing protein n=1 Tax=Lottia gigantea TaxID=225164 RepID=V4CE55_LOTGI|nr:hypothetical protein LOTGIDRAFT_141127 [Lottia gigantea]ESP00240.1 hypothetical protein LOTGIDRAFT_141127 [Lottia gigantea]
MGLNKLILVSVVFLQVYSLKDKKLSIGGIFPMNGSWAGGQACLPAVLMALQDVNNRSDILRDYELEMSFDDSQCMPGLGTKVLYNLLYTKPVKLMVLSGCSIVSTFVAQAAKMWNLVVLAYGASSPALSNRQRFPTFFRTHPSATLHNPTRVKIFQKFGWTKIATIQDTQEVFQSTKEDLSKRVKAAGINIVATQTFLTDPVNAVRSLKRQDARIIVGLFYEDAARKVFCQVYKEKLYGKKYVWLLIGWYPDNWYKSKLDSINCTGDQLAEALEGHFTTEAVILHQDSSMTDVGMTAPEFTRRLDEKLRYEKNITDTSLVTGYPEAPLAYDAVWAMALALNKTAVRLAEKNLSLLDFDYVNKNITDEIYSAMNSTKFLGVSGNVAFSSQGDRIAWTQIEQMINGTYHKLGYYDSVADNLTWFGKEKWKGGKIPKDHTVVVNSLRVVSPALYYSMCGVASLGILAGVVCLLFNYTNRNRRIIALSQPLVNSITCIGCMICLLCIFMVGLDGKFLPADKYSLKCQVGAWILSIGFTLGYGSMFAKVWMVHKLTTASKKERKEWGVHVVLSIFLALDVAILTIWQIMDPLQRKLEFFPLENPRNTDEDIKLLPQLEHCYSEHLSIWLGVLFGYKSILLIFGIFLSYELRSVKLKQVNDSKFVAMGIYNVVVMCVITAPITLIIGHQQDATFAFISLAIVLCSFLSMGLLFVPKMVEVKRHSSADEEDNSGLTDSLVSREEEERHQRLLAENEQLKKQIADVSRFMSYDIYMSLL